MLVARQPILDRDLMVVGQELLHRDVAGNAPVNEVDGLRATATILIEGVLVLGLELTRERPQSRPNGAGWSGWAPNWASPRPNWPQPTWTH